MGHVWCQVYKDQTAHTHTHIHEHTNTHTHTYTHEGSRRTLETNFLIELALAEEGKNQVNGLIKTLLGGKVGS